MPRVARIVIPGCAHHITQRGNNRQGVFVTGDDRRLYLRLLAGPSRNGDWHGALRRRQDEKERAGIRLSTHRGRPLGSDAFLSKMESLLGRRLRPLPVGRPRKRTTNETKAHGRNR